MTPQQITDALEEIISNIADAHILIARLGREMGNDKRPELDVVYSDIWADADLSEINKRLRIWENQLARALDFTLPEHFERLRAAEPDPDAQRDDAQDRALRRPRHD